MMRSYLDSVGENTIRNNVSKELEDRETKRLVNISVAKARKAGAEGEKAAREAADLKAQIERELGEDIPQPPRKPEGPVKVNSKIKPSRPIEPIEGPRIGKVK